MNRLLNKLTRALLFVLSLICLSGCQPEEIFVSEIETAEEALYLVPEFEDISANSEQAWETFSDLVRHHFYTSHVPFIPIVIYDELMHPQRFQNITTSKWCMPVTAHHVVRVFNYDSRSPEEKEGTTTRNYAHLNARVLRDHDNPPFFPPHSCSAMLYGVDKEGFSQLCHHYPHHTLLPVIVSKQKGNDPIYTLGFIFSVTKTEFLTSKYAQPIRSHFYDIWTTITTHEFLKEYGDSITDHYPWDTYLADEETFVVDLLDPWPV